MGQVQFGTVNFALRDGTGDGTGTVTCNLLTVSIQGPGDSLGISVAGGMASPHGDVPLFIASMETTGLAARTQKLQVG